MVLNFRRHFLLIFLVCKRSRGRLRATFCWVKNHFCIKITFRLTIHETTYHWLWIYLCCLQGILVDELGDTMIAVRHELYQLPTKIKNIPLLTVPVQMYGIKKKGLYVCYISELIIRIYLYQENKLVYHPGKKFRNLAFFLTVSLTSLRNFLNKDENNIVTPHVFKAKISYYVWGIFCL